MTPGGCEKWLDSGHLLEVALQGFAGASAVGSERRGARDESKLPARSTGAATYRAREGGAGSMFCCGGWETGPSGMPMRLPDRDVKNWPWMCKSAAQGLGLCWRWLGVAMHRQYLKP